MKIGVYTICKNEEKEIPAWLENTQEFDARFVVDTGSTDHSVIALKSGGAVVAEMILDPFRYDKARQAALTLACESCDIVVVLDLDERFRPGWRQEIERSWRPGVTKQIAYTFIHSWNADGSPQNVFGRDLIHDPDEFYWKHACHEALYAKRTEGEVLHAPDIVCEHHQDLSKPRPDRIALLELDVQENPECPRSWYHLAREYWLHKKQLDAGRIFSQFMSLPDSHPPERSVAMRFIAKIASNYGETQDALAWFRRACDEFPQQREPFVDLAEFCFAIGEYLEGYTAIKKALRITKRLPLACVESRCWGDLPAVLHKKLAQKMGRPS